MTEPHVLWVFLLAHTGLFVVSSLMAALTYCAYRHSDGQRSYVTATVGFGLVVLGGLVDPLFQLGTGILSAPTGTELLVLGSVETALIAIGLGILFYAVTQHDTGSSSVEADDPVWIDDEPTGFDDQQYGD